MRSGGVVPTSPALLLSLGLLSGFLSAVPFIVVIFPLLVSASTDFGFGGAAQLGTSHTTPVKLFNEKVLRCHLRQGLPVRSRARSPAFIAP